MKKRLAVWSGVGLALLLGVALVLPASHFLLLGWLRSEAFYQGKPTSYWISALKKEPFLGDKAPKGDIGKLLAEGGPESVPVLGEMLNHEDQEIRQQALLALAVMGPEANAAVPKLIEVIGTEENTGCFQLETGLLLRLDQHAAVAVLAEALKNHPSTRSRLWAVSILMKLGPEAKDAASPLRQALEDSDPYFRVSAAQALWQINQEAEPILPTLVEGITSSNQGAGSLAATVLRDIARDFGSVGQEAIPGLLQALKHEDARIRWLAADSLWLVGPTPACVPALIAALSDEAESVRSAAANALGKIKAKEAIPALIAALTDDQLQVRNSAVMALGWIGNKQAVPALIAVLKHQSGDPRWLAASALGRIGPEAKDAVPTLIEVMKDKKMRSRVVRALGEIGPEARRAVPALTEALKDDDPDVRVGAALALWQIDRQTKTTVPVLSDLLKAGEVDRVSAAAALCRVAPQTGFPELCRMIRDKNFEYREYAIRAAEELGAEAEPAVPALIEVLKSDHLGLPQAAAHALGKIGPAARPAVPALLEMAQDRQHPARKAAAEALKIINHQSPGTP